MGKFGMGFYPIISESMTEDEFVSICKDFSRYENGRYEIPLNVCEVIQACKKMGFEDEKTSGVQIILLTSIIELLSSTGKSSGVENVRSFFIKITPDEKINLLNKVKIKYGVRLFAPFCFQDKPSCMSSSGYFCHRDVKKGECPAIISENVLNEGIIKFSNFLYGLRSVFAHEARIPSFSYTSKPEDFGLPGNFILGGGRTITQTYVRTREYTGTCFTELNPNDIFILIMKYLHRLFREYLKNIT